MVGVSAWLVITSPTHPIAIQDYFANALPTRRLIKAGLGMWRTVAAEVGRESIQSS
jgi:hypothetical protein